MNRPACACVGRDHAGRGNTKPAIIDDVGAEQRLAARVRHLEEVFARGEAGSLSWGVRTGTPIEINGAFGDELSIGVDDGSVHSSVVKMAPDSGAAASANERDETTTSIVKKHLIIAILKIFFMEFRAPFSGCSCCMNIRGELRKPSYVCFGRTE